MAKKKGKLTNAPPPLTGLKVFPDELAPIKEYLSSRYEFVRHLGQGQNGRTYVVSLLAHQQHEVCLKVSRPDLTGAAKDKAVDAIKKEYNILSTLSHRCLPRIYDSSLDSDLPFYLCTFHPGVTFYEFRQNHNTLPFHDAITVLWSFADAIKYLHANDRTHCDMHLKNVLISGEVAKDGILLIDLGSGHRGSDSSPLTEMRGNVILKDTFGAANNRQLVPRAEANISGASADFAAFGQMMTEMRTVFTKHASPASLKVYDSLARQLKAHQISSWTTVEAFLLRVVDPFRQLSANADVFLDNEGLPLTIVTPGLTRVPVGTPSLSVINTPIFQRLRGLRQLSFCDWPFPGATHSRFEHSLGVFANAKKAIEALVHDEHFQSNFDEVEVRGFLLAALIHDVGHYPFAHVVEQYVSGRFPGDDAARQIAAHETRTLQLLKENEPLREAVSRYWSSCAIECEKVLTSKHGALSLLLSGPVDIDKMDYVARDALHCGLHFGEGLEVDTIMSALICDSKGGDLLIAERGSAAAAGLLLAQDQMLSQVYWDERVRSLFAMLHSVLATIIGRDPQSLQNLVTQLQKTGSDYEGLEAIRRVTLQHKQKNSIEKPRCIQIIKAIQSGNFTNSYRMVACYSHSDKTLRRNPNNVFGLIVTTDPGTASTIPIKWDMARKLKNSFLTVMKKLNITADTYDVLIDVPYGKSRRRMLQVVSSDGSTRYDLVQKTHLKESVFSHPALYHSPVRVYVSPRVKGELDLKGGGLIEAAEEEFVKLVGDDATASVSEFV